MRNVNHDAYDLIRNLLATGRAKPWIINPPSHVREQQQPKQPPPEDRRKGREAA